VRINIKALALDLQPDQNQGGVEAGHNHKGLHISFITTLQTIMRRLLPGPQERPLAIPI